MSSNKALLFISLFYGTELLNYVAQLKVRSIVQTAHSKTCSSHWSQHLKNSQLSVEHEVLLPCLQEPTIGPQSEPFQSITHYHILFLLRSPKYFLVFRFSPLIAQYSDSLQAGRLRIESWWGQDYPHLSRMALGSTKPPIQWVPRHSWG